MPHKLLLADDSVTIQRVIELTFADEDVHVIAVGDGKQAIDRVQQEPPDIVLADIGMPERDGYEVASFIKNNPQLAHIPVLLLTGAFEPIDENRARSVGCDGVLVKPFEPQMVINRVRDLLAGRRPAGLWTTGAAGQPAGRVPQAGEVDLRAPAAAPGAAAGARGSDSLEDYFDRLDAAFGSPEKPVAAAPPPPPPPPPPSPAPIPIAVASAPPQRNFEEPELASAGGPPPPPPVDISEWDPHLPGDAPAVPRPAPTPVPVAGSRPADSHSSWNPDASAASAVPAVAAPPQPSAAPAPPPQTAPAPPAPLPQAAPAPPTPVPQGVPAPRPETAPAPASHGVPQMPSLADAFAALLAAEQGQPIVPSSHRTGSLANDQIDDIVKRVIERMGDQSMRRAVLDAAERLVREEIERIKSR